ncbi:MAG: prenyltransferase, partial [Thermoplasmatota archaeon]
MKEGEKEPGFLEMIRAPFLFAIIVPLFSGTLVSVSITGEFNLVGFLLVLVIGISLHITTNVYNDIYDTKQGADNQSSMKSEFSGGSGILVERPGILPKMFSIARGGIVIGIMGSFLLMFFIEQRLWLNLWIIIGICVFLSKYYTAAPIKFAYRGLGEIIVWIGFGPLAVLLAGIGQNLFYHPVLLSITPITGLGTLFIVWMGEMVDLPTDRDGGKHGLVARM